MRNYRRYPEYKGSGIEWLGKIPAHWEVRRLKCLVTINDEVLPETTGPDFEISYVDIGSVDSTDGIVHRETYIFANAPSRARRIVRHGDVIVSTVRTYLRAIAPIVHPEPNLIVSTGFAVIRPRTGLATRFSAYALQSPYFVERVVAHSVGVSYPAINASELGAFPIAVPSEVEQRAIADFLDRETAKIDALIEKKERLIELLKEKRTALITHAVTKGLDPNVPMKDSGIEWLGEIPAHWEVVSVKHFAEIVNGATPRSSEPEYWNGDIAWATPDDLGQLRSRVLEDTSRHITQKGYASCGTTLVPPGSLVLSTRAPIGHLAIAGCELCINQGCRGLVLSEHDSATYRYYSILAAKPILQSLGEGSTFRELPRGTLANVILPNPTQEEKNAIADFLDRETAKIDALIEKIEEAIKLLKEYRTALISAAVTGKIDVRNE